MLNHLKGLSRQAKRDPSGTERLINEFEARLVAMFDRLKQKIGEMSLPESLKKNELIRPDDDLYPAHRYAMRMLAIDSADQFYKDLIAQINATILDAKGKAVMDKYAQQFYYSGKAKSSAFLKSVGIDASLGLVPEDWNGIDIIQTKFYASMKGVTDAMRKEIMSELTDGMLNGEGAEQLQRRIRQVVDDIGIARARMIARTESMYAFNNSSKANYERYGIEKVQWLTSGLEGVCGECQDNGDHDPFDIASVPDIPAHPNCRCVLVPVRG